LSFTVAERRREIGIRMALGAEKSAILRRILAEGLSPAFLGLLLGGSIAASTGRYLETFLYGVKGSDPITYLVVAVVLVAAAAAACWWPAQRAAGVEPVSALRQG
ncbi:MAG: FtsX-like permease family protein, partial [Holophagales bacterium]|nr:FtsX-like permease family protein [Holophagales bacterium]